MRIVCDATLAFIKRCNVLSAVIEMTDFREQRACIKFCVQLAVDKRSSGRTADCDGYLLSVDTSGGSASGKEFQNQKK